MSDPARLPISNCLKSKLAFGSLKRTHLADISAAQRRRHTAHFSCYVKSTSMQFYEYDRFGTLFDRFSMLNYHRLNPFEEVPRNCDVVYRLGESIGVLHDGKVEYPGAKMVAVFVDGYVAANMQLEGLCKAIKGSAIYYEDAVHLGFHDESMSVRDKFLYRRGYEYASVPSSLVKAAAHFAPTMGTVSFSYVTVELEDLQQFTNETKANTIECENLRISDPDYEFDQRTFNVSRSVSKFFFKGTRPSLVAALVQGCDRKIFIEISTELLTKGLWKKMRSNFHNVQILQFNSGKLNPAIALPDLIYRRGDYNRLVDLRFNGVEFGAEQFQSILLLIRRSRCLTQLAIKDWKPMGEDQSDPINQLLATCHESNIRKLYLEDVPFTTIPLLVARLEDFNLNDVHIRALSPAEGSEETRYNCWEPHKKELHYMVLAKMRSNMTLGAIRDDDCRLDACINRNAGFLVEVFNSDQYYEPMFSEGESEMLYSFCGRNYNHDCMDLRQEERANRGVQPIPARDHELENAPMQEDNEAPVVLLGFGLGDGSIDPVVIPQSPGVNNN